MAQSSSISLKLEKDKEYKQAISSKTTLSQTIDGEKSDVVITTTHTMNFLVKTISQNAYLLDVKYEKQSMLLQMPEETMEFSSEKKDTNDIISNFAGAMMNKSFEVLMSKTGKIIEVKDYESLLENAANQFVQLSEAEKEELKALIMKSNGIEAVKNNIEMATAIYPDKPVNKSDKWTVDSNCLIGVPSKMSTNYELASFTSKYALIKGYSILKTIDKNKYIESDGILMKYDLTGSMVSDINVDKNTGWVINAKITQEIKGDTYIKENSQSPDEMKIPMTITTEIMITN
jgi:hypothetical protein